MVRAPSIGLEIVKEIVGTGLHGHGVLYLARIRECGNGKAQPT